LKSKIRSFFAHMDWIDWLLAIGFIGAFTWVGYAVIDFPYWLIFPVAAVVLLGMAKNRRERMRSNEDEDSDKSGQ
jgi:hypothetical protein